MESINTYNSGTLSFIMYPTNENTFVAACKELCLVREGKDQELLKYQITADAHTYIENVCKNKLGEHLLNQDLPKEIIDEFNEYRVKKRNEDFQKWVASIKTVKENKVGV